jgi:DNA-binding SARP family transcriptional activator
VLDERERCRQLCLHGLEQEGRRLLRQGNHAAAIDVALAVVAAAPLRDSAHRLVIEIHLAEANVDEAIQAFHRYRGLLRAELGLEPSPMIRRLLAGHGVPDRAWGSGHPGVTALAEVRSGSAGVPATH